MTDEQADILRAAFASVDGEKALAVLRDLSGVDRGCYFCANEREEAYFLGKIDFFRAIEKALNDNQTKAKNGRNR